MKQKVTIFWFRRDLRLDDNAGLTAALSSVFPVLPIFIFDPSILNALEDKKDRRVDYIHQALSAINHQLFTKNTSLRTFYDEPMQVFKELAEQYHIQSIYCNRDYEPQAVKRDTEIYNFFKEQNIAFHALKDQVIFDKRDILKNDQTPYTVYTPYSKKWKSLLTPQHYNAYETNNDNFLNLEPKEVLSLASVGFEKTDLVFEKPRLDASIINSYHQYRDYPAIQGTTQLGIALRFGTISVRSCVAYAIEHNEVWLNELIWREFFMQILYHFPKVVNNAFKSKYDNIEWRNNEQEFEKWCEGNTGIPFVDAGMRQLNATGFMHNRVRMITASFLCKHLLIDWRWGEAYFAQKLNDYDLAANNGNWQWAAGCGCDAAPYFRIFNPTTQLEKFDKEQKYIQQWIPELHTPAYPRPLVEHHFARERALSVYKQAIQENF